MGAKEVKRRALADGIAPRTLDRAKARLGVKAAPDGYRGPWVWRLPEPGTVRQSAPDFADSAKGKSLAHCDESGALWAAGERSDADSGPATGAPAVEQDGPAVAAMMEPGTAEPAPERPETTGLDPERPGALDLLDAEQRRRYRAIYMTRDGMPPGERHARAWRAALRPRPAARPRAGYLDGDGEAKP